MPRSLLQLASLSLVAAALLAPGLARAQCGQLPVLLVVQDRSGSMQDTPDPYQGGSSKWTIASDAVPQVLNQYTNEFQFGLMLFPGSAWSCDTGYVELAVPSSPSDIQGAYWNNGPGGGTPTAVTLSAARQYLDSLHLSVPAYILLITDGMPNCNAGSNGATCSCTVNGSCDPNYGGSQYNCLDDSSTEGAAGSAYGAGYKVFVVGFGAASTAGNNKQVLDAIASYGGTGHAYSADDQSSLESTLNTIVGSVGSCCQNVCSPGQSQCDGTSSGIQSCQMTASGCYGWVTSSCGGGQACQNGSCSSCSGTCTPGATMCGFWGDLETCTADSNGCTDWSSSWCPSGTTCSGSSCQACNSTCSPGQSMCQNGQLVTCETDVQGCTDWSVSSCGYGTVCTSQGSGAACQSCSQTCTAGSQLCQDGNTASVCVADANGCTSWQLQGCGSGQTCSGGTCNACNACNLGDSRCTGSVPQSCVDLGNGCTGWADGSPCGSGTVCQNGACNACPGACNVGDVQCTGSDVQVCQPQSNACNAWVTVQSCGAGQTCSGGACCDASCNPGETRCDTSGNIQICAGQPGTCPSWQTSACGAGTACVSGACLQPCTTSNEIGSCPSGQTCQTTAQGGYCFPDGSGSTGASTSGSTGSGGGTTTGDASSGSSDPSATQDDGSGSGGDATGGKNGARQGTSIQSSGCGSVDGSALLALLPVLAVLRRRRG